MALSRDWKPAVVEGMPNVFTGGWVGYCGYDTVRYVYSSEHPPLFLLVLCFLIPLQLTCMHIGTAIQRLLVVRVQRPRLCC